MAARLDPDAYLRSIRTNMPRNCGAFLCGWVERVRGEDPAPHVRNLDRRQWVPLLNAAGGLGAMVRAIAEEIGAAPVGAGALCPGDVAVAEIPTGVRRMREACAIRTSRQTWAFWSPDGCWETSFVHPSLIWRL